mmetsp:Transcript_13136/g.24683  ORF Transcript_13136/g.24683 Transcript_13136/m.24683 type:complete len:267 (-) Transcript_13136:420-1220(-)
MIAGKHLGKSRQYWRDIILGVNDGLVSTFLLVAGVAGAGLASKDILLTALAGALAGAISMAAGEYVATKSQNEVMRGEINLEEEHVKYNLHEELLELDDLLQKIGIKTRVSATASASTAASSMRDEEEEKEKGQDKCVSMVDLHESMKDYYKENPDALLELMKALEFGVIDKEVRNPIMAGLFSCVLFILGALPSVLPFIFSGEKPIKGLITSACITILALLMVGAIKTWATRGNCFVAAVENLVIAGFGGGIAYGVGYLFESVIR